MRPQPVVTVALLVAATATLAAGLPADVPKRKPGLWEMKTSMPEMGGMGQSLQICVGDKTDELLAERGDHNADCKQKSYRKEGDRVVFDSVCKMGGTTATTRGVFNGNFVDSYRGEIRTTYAPPLEGMAQSTMTQEARWIGPCRPGQKPGDVMMEGMRGMPGMNLDDMMKNMPAPQR